MTSPEHVDSTRAIYDFSAGYYARAVGTTVSSAFERPIDRAVLHAFCEDLLVEESASVLDIGCGVGRVTSLLHERGLDVRGFDLSGEMIDTARSAHPGLLFDVASMTALPVADGAAAGAVLWYSIIHTPPEALHEVWAELARVVTGGGHILVGFQCGRNERVQREDAFGSGLTMTWYRHDHDDVVRQVEWAGFVLRSRVWRDAQLAHETTPQAFLTFQRDASVPKP